MMPEVTENFIKSAKMLSQAVPGLLDKLEEQKMLPKQAAEDVRVQSEVVADTLIQQGLVKETEKSAAVAQLSDHKECLNILNRTAQQVAASTLGSGGYEKKSSDNNDSGLRESDRGLLTALGFNV